MKRTGIVIATLGLIFFAQSALADWTPAKRLTWTSSYSWHPAVAVDSLDTVHVVWEDMSPGNWEIYYKRGK